MPLRAPQRVYDFTLLSRTRPREQQPGDRLDAQFDEHAQSIRSIIEHLRVKEAPRPPDELADLRRQVDGVLQSVIEVASVTRARGEEATARIEASLAQAQAAFLSAQRSADALRLDRDEARDQLTSLQAKIDELEARVEGLSSMAPLSSPIAGLEFEPPVLGVNAGGFYSGDVLGATATSADFAQVSIEWAEHMPDTIPGNILAINAITGDHWSSRWWANKAAAIWGGASAWMYLGAYPHTNAPTETPTGEPLQQGMLYYDTTLSQGMVWNGGAWQELGNPQPSITSALYYVATAGQTVFPLSVGDLYGHTFVLQIGQGVAVYLNGVRLTPDDGSGTKGDYTVSISSSTVTLLTGAPAGMIVAIDAMTLPAQLAPSVAKLRKLKPLTPAFDGTTTVFTMQSADGTTVNVTATEQVIYSLDGVTQEPVVAFTASGATLTFATAPTADAYGFGIWASAS